MARVFVIFACLTFLGSQALGDEAKVFEQFLASLGVPVCTPDSKPAIPVSLISATQDFGALTFNASCHTYTPIKLGDKTYAKGLGTHANSRIVFQLNVPARKFIADVGIDNNDDTRRGAEQASAAFLVKGDDRELAKTPVCRWGQPAQHIEASLENVKQLELVVSDTGDSISFDQADWADAQIIDAQGKAWSLSDLAQLVQPCPFLQPASLPASFVYGGQSSTALLQQWPCVKKPVVETDSRKIFEMTWREPDGGFAATWRLEVLKDRPAAEFRWIFENQGTVPCKPLTEVFALDLQTQNLGRPAKLVHSSGGLTGPFTGEPAAFLIAESTLTAPKTLSAAGGRSSNKDLPFFVLHNPVTQDGVFVGIGWSGQWQADFQPNVESRTLRATAGMPGMNLALPAGERIASPTVLLGVYRGDSQSGCNALRRTIYDHYVALLDGKKPLPPVSWNHWFTFANNVSEDLLKKQIDAAGDLGLEYFCIDSGWFDGDFPQGVGNWTINRKKFPNGLAPVSKYAAEKGMKLGLWFEPARADSNTRLQREHPDWVVQTRVRYELPEVREWVFKMMCDFIDEGHVRWIRYDYNFDPLTQWEPCDTPETKGLTQIRYILGEYELLDKLMAKYPDLLIESCSSGGRRIDLETIRRAHTFWKSDETGSIRAAREQETGANYFLPGVLLNTNLPASSSASLYDLHCLFGGPLGFATDWTKLDAAAKERVRSQIAVYKKVRHVLDKDYYPLFPQTYELREWVGWEFYDRATGEGLCVVLRPDESIYGSAEIRLRGLDADKKYRVTKLDGGVVCEQSGGGLAEGLVVSLGHNQSEVLHLQKLE